MKKKIIFMVINMNIGGTEKALLNMITDMPKDHYDITILMLEKHGGFLNSIPDHVHLEYLIGYREIKRLLNLPPSKIVWQLLQKGHFIKMINVIFYLIMSKVTKEKSLFYKYLCRHISYNPKKYDLAVAYAGPMDFISYFVAKKINAKKKIQWIHFDVRKIGFNKHFANKIYKYFNKIFVVSNEGAKILSNILPSFKKRIEPFPNILSQKHILKMAEEGKGFDDNFSGFRILTVGRLSREKGQDLTIPVLAKLKKNGYNVKWYCVGEGNARKEYKKMIEEYGLQNDYILLGSNPNPYPYMKQCDIYVQPSRHEGYCITLAEARIFEKPIIATDFVGVREQIIDGETGYIVNFNEKDIYFKIAGLIKNMDLMEDLKDNLTTNKGINKSDINLLLNLI